MQKTVLPGTSTVVFEAIRTLLNKGWIQLPIDLKLNGSAAPGDFLESLLGVKRNNNDSPDFKDWEIKFHGGNSLLTLFHKEPKPRGVMKKFVDDHGWDDEHGRISFRHTLSGESERCFVKNESDQFSVHSKTKVDSIAPYWDHNTLLNAAGSKLRRLIVVSGTYDKAGRRVHYQTAVAYWEFDLIGFCKAIEVGKVYIDFDARTKLGRGTALRNHGTKFRIKVKDLPSLYVHSYVIK